MRIGQLVRANANDWTIFVVQLAKFNVPFPGHVPEPNWQPRRCEKFGSWILAKGMEQNIVQGTKQEQIPKNLKSMSDDSLEFAGKILLTSPPKINRHEIREKEAPGSKVMPSNMFKRVWPVFQAAQ